MQPRTRTHAFYSLFAVVFLCASFAALHAYAADDSSACRFDEHTKLEHLPTQMTNITSKNGSDVRVLLTPSAACLESATRECAKYDTLHAGKHVVVLHRNKSKACIVYPVPRKKEARIGWISSAHLSRRNVTVRHSWEGLWHSPFRQIEIQRNEEKGVYDIDAQAIGVRGVDLLGFEVTQSSALYFEGEVSGNIMHLTDQDNLRCIAQIKRVGELLFVRDRAACADAARLTGVYIQTESYDDLPSEEDDNG